MEKQLAGWRLILKLLAGAGMACIIRIPKASFLHLLRKKKKSFGVVLSMEVICCVLYPCVASDLITYIRCKLTQEVWFCRPPLLGSEAW